MTISRSQLILFALRHNPSTFIFAALFLLISVPSATSITITHRLSHTLDSPGLTFICHDISPGVCCRSFSSSVRWPYDYVDFTGLQSMAIAIVWEPRVDRNAVVISGCGGQVQQTHYLADGGSWTYGPAFLHGSRAISGACYIVLDVKGKNPMEDAQGVRGFAGGKGQRFMAPFDRWWVRGRSLGRREFSGNGTSTTSVTPVSTGPAMPQEGGSRGGWMWPDEIWFDGTRYVHVDNPQDLIYQDEEGQLVDFGLLMPFRGQ